jgi:dienelactone hydrolase
MAAADLADLPGYDRSTFTHDGKERAVYRTGTGPAVVVIAEMPGITPKVAEFGRTVAGIGCTAVLPHLFGQPGRAVSPKDGVKAVPYLLSSLAPACVSREFSTWATDRTSPVVSWLRALAAAEHERCGGPGVGAVGMCFTGGFALAMAADDRHVAPVLSQPSLPFGVTAKQKRSIDCSPDDLAVVKHRCSAEGLQVLGLRYRGDRMVPGERFDFLREQLGDAFVAVELDGDDHSVLTEHLDEGALAQVLDLFRQKLLT